VSRKKREYEDIDAVDDVDVNDDTDSGDDDNEYSEGLEPVLFSGKRTAIVPPMVGRLLSPHIV
jgi:hypothetical protein